MAHFYGGVSGTSKTRATRLGTKNSGLSAFVRGWDIGGNMVLRENNGKDYLSMAVDLGSNHPLNQIYIDAAIEEDGKLHVRIGRMAETQIDVVVHDEDY